MIFQKGYSIKNDIPSVNIQRLIVGIMHIMKFEIQFTICFRTFYKHAYTYVINLRIYLRIMNKARIYPHLVNCVRKKHLNVSKAI